MSNLAFWKIRLISILVGSALVIGLGLLALTKTGTSLRYLSYDLPFLVHRAGEADDVRIVYLDEMDGEKVDRSGQAALLDALAEAGVRAVVYDLIFQDPWPNPQVDLEFAAAMLRFRGIDANGKSIPGVPQRMIFLATGSTPIERSGMVGQQMVPPDEDILEAAGYQFGLADLVRDDQFTVRELPVGTYDEPSLSWSAARALGAQLEEDPEKRIAPRWLNYAGPPGASDSLGAQRAIKSCSAADVLEGGIANFLRDKIVVIGGKPALIGAAAGQDLFSTPFHRFDGRGDLPLASGVEIQANALLNFLNGNWLTATKPRFDKILISLCGLFIGLVFCWLKPIRGLLFALILILILIAVGVGAVHFRQFWFPWSVIAFLQVPLGFIWGGASHFYLERFHRRKLSRDQLLLRGAFSKYLSPQMLDQLTADDFQMKLGGEKIQAAMMFTDLENFTDVCEQVGDPGRIVETLNDYFERTTDHIFDHRGVVIKFIGDAIFAGWGAPIPDPDAARNAVRAAWRLFESDKLVIDGVSIRTRIGLHFGEVVAGNIGSKRRVDYTMIGDAVNLAARLESLNKMVGTQILMSHEIHRELSPEFRTRRVGKFQVKGRKEGTQVYELLGRALESSEPSWLSNYHLALEALEAGDTTTARAGFAEVQEVRQGGDGPSAFLLSALEQGIVLPDGAIKMIEK